MRSLVALLVAVFYGVVPVVGQGPRKWIIVDTVEIPVDTFWRTDTLRRTDTVTLVRVDTVPRVCPICPVPVDTTLTPPTPPDTTTPPPVPGSHEPAGFTRVADWTGTLMPPLNGSTTWSGPTSWGKWSFWDFGGEARIVSAVTPSGDGKAVETVYPAGFNNGTEPVEIGGWFSGGGTYRKLYFRSWVQYGTGSTWEMHPVGNKAGFFAYGCTNSARNDGYFFLDGSGGSTPTLMSSMRWTFIQQNNVNRKFTTTGRIIAGKWQLWELLLEVNSVPGAADGRLTMWLDGVLVGRWTDVKYTTSGCESPFYYWKWRATWGGNITGLRKSRADVVRHDGMYLSGVN